MLSQRDLFEIFLFCVMYESIIVEFIGVENKFSSVNIWQNISKFIWFSQISDVDTFNSILFYSINKDLAIAPAFTCANVNENCFYKFKANMMYIDIYFNITQLQSFLFNKY